MNKKTLTIFLISLIISLTISGCVETIGEEIEIPVEEQEKIIYETESGAKVYRIHDDELNVTCYVFDKYKGGGISCISDSQIYGE